MIEEEAIWYVIVKGVQQGPLTKAQVFELLRGGTLVGSDPISCSGSQDWKSVSEISLGAAAAKLSPSTSDHRRQMSVRSAVIVWLVLMTIIVLAASFLA